MKRLSKLFPWRRAPQPDQRQLDLFGDSASLATPAPEPAPVPQPPVAPAPIALLMPPNTPGLRRAVLSGHTVEYVLRRSKRRTIGFMISDEGLRITAPRWVTLAGIEEAMINKTAWILAKLAERRERVVQRAQARSMWAHGERFPYFGGEVTLHFGSPEQGMAFDAVAGVLLLGLPMDASEAEVKQRVQAWLEERARALFAERLPVWADKLGVTYSSFALSSATTQWGSCTSAGRIRLNWRLMHFSLALIDYVIVHELSHLREMNHSPRFWATVGSVYPGYEKARQALQKRSREIMPLFN
jgi:predicted metal-dependent hydrolase